MYKFTNAFRILTLVIFLASLIYAYAAIPSDVDFGGELLFGSIPSKVNKASFFFGMLVLCMGVNLLIMAIVRNYKRKWEVASKGSPINLGTLPAWFYGMAGWLNLFFVLGVFYIGFTNSAEEINISNYSLVLYALPILIFLWLLYLPFLLRSQETE
jgi:hypothetical protein